MPKTIEKKKSFASAMTKNRSAWNQARDAFKGAPYYSRRMTSAADPTAGGIAAPTAVPISRKEMQQLPRLGAEAANEAVSEVMGTPQGVELRDRILGLRGSLQNIETQGGDATAINQQILAAETELRNLLNNARRGMQESPSGQIYGSGARNMPTAGVGMPGNVLGIRG